MSDRLLEFIHLSRFFIRKTESNEPSDDSTECDTLLFGCDDLSFALPEKASISLSDLDLPNTFAVVGECEYVGKEGGSSFFDSFTGLESTFTTRGAEITATGGEGATGGVGTWPLSRFFETVRAILVLAIRSMPLVLARLMPLVLARPMPCRRRFRRSLTSPGSAIHIS